MLSRGDEIAQHQPPSPGGLIDATGIGGGVVGCAMARRFTLKGKRVALLEKAPDILNGASKANSAILHTGFGAPKGSLALDCVKNGYQEFLSLPEGLEDICAKAHANRIEVAAIIASHCAAASRT